jgi:hypothetical protein
MEQGQGIEEYGAGPGYRRVWSRGIEEYGASLSLSFSLSLSSSGLSVEHGASHPTLGPPASPCPRPTLSLLSLGPLT